LTWIRIEGRLARSMTAGADSEAAALRRTEQLVARAQAGDGSAFEQLILDHSARVYRLLVRMLGSTADAEEVAQETFLKAWRALPRFRAEAQFSTWLHRIAVNEANRRLARESRRYTVPIDDAALQIPDLSKGPAARAESAELEAFLEICVRELPPDYRAAVILRDIEGMTNEEAAELLALELANFKSRLHRGRMAIRRRVEERYAD
jgi:RNA polymerase sigma-70 factor (ECF subfamily)